MSASVFDLNRDEDYDDDSFERARVNEKTEVVKAWFSSRLSYSYESVLGSGANGVAWLLVQAAQDGSQGRKFVMKRAMEDRDAISQLRNEIKVLRLLAGSQHIVQIIPSLDLEDDAEFRRELTLITEYLPNGTLDRLITRLESRSNYVPNRLLWRVFLCCKYVSVSGILRRC
jgi:serine/threonine protein kinase